MTKRIKAPTATVYCEGGIDSWGGDYIQEMGLGAFIRSIAYYKRRKSIVKKIEFKCCQEDVLEYLTQLKDVILLRYFTATKHTKITFRYNVKETI